ncbi:MAG: hypothetical protein BWY31_02837 [Lentisphaerae bacterium ADurb.Bin242]|nr:MAG: hypothetical protein BWY31_02837 [Lentisphaerae bacterium ADurb.Bin242]
MTQHDLSFEHLQRQIDLSWACIWNHFYLPKTHLVYDQLTSLEKGHEYDCFPTPEEVRRSEPNVCGWGTGMDDSATGGGVMLSMICDRYAVAAGPEMHEAAREIFLGLKACAAIHGVRGFVARSICPADGKSVYLNTSRDQYTHFVHGFWKLYRSPLADAEMKKTIPEVVADIALSMEKHVTPENGYCAAMLDGRPAQAVCEMWGLDTLYPQEAARLPMIYAAAWRMTGDRHFRELCCKYLRPAAEHSCRLFPGPANAFALLQMACSLELLLETLPEEQECMDLCRKAMYAAAECARYNEVRATEIFNQQAGVIPAFTDWRKSERITCCGLSIPEQPAHKVQPERDMGQAALVQLMAPGYSFPESQKILLKQMIARSDFAYIPGNGPMYLQAAYWRLLRDLMF